MPLKTPQQYKESLKNTGMSAYIGADKIENPASHPMIAPHVNAVAKIYEAAQDSRYKNVMLAKSHLTGKTINRFTHIFMSTEDLKNKIKMQRLLGQLTGTCFQRCVGLDALNSMYAVSFEIDKKKSTDYHKRFIRYLSYVQENDLMVAGAMTDPKGHRSKKPSEQEDQDQYLRVVEQRPDGVVIRGAKLHNTGGINSHEILVLPGTGLKENESAFAIACAVPVAAEGVHFIFGRQSNDDRKLKGSGLDIGNPSYGVVGGEAMIVFDNVFVPHERVFLNGETSFCASLVSYFATWHRANYGGCKGGNSDVLVGATAKLSRIQGTEKNNIIKDKLIEMIHLMETCYAGAIGAASEGYQLPCGSYMFDPMMSNTVKQNITRNVYAVARLAHDISGGFLATMPGEEAFKSPEIGSWVKKYHLCSPDDEPLERIRLGRYIENATSTTTLVEAMHGAGSPQAQRIAMFGLAHIEEKICLIENILNSDTSGNGL